MSNATFSGISDSLGDTALCQAQSQSVSMRSCEGTGGMIGGRLSPLELLDQAEDDELLRQLEGLTLNLDCDPQSTIQTSANAESEAEAATMSSVGGEPNGEHGTRSEFIKNVSERLIACVNAEAGDLEQAKVLMHQYMIEFCTEYDRCGYGLKVDTLSDQSQASTARTSASSASLNPKDSRDMQRKPQLEFDNQILKKGVRVLSKNLQKAHEQSRVKDQQHQLMRNFIKQQHQQITALKSQLVQLQDHQPSQLIETQQKLGNQPRAEARNIQQLQLGAHAQPDSAMAGPELYQLRA